MAMTWVPLATEVARLAGDLDSAEALGRESVDTFSDIGYPAFVSVCAAHLADVLIERGDLGSADRYAALAEQEALEADVYVQFLWRAARARVLARTGAFAEAEVIGADAVAIASLTDALCDRARTHLALAEVFALAGKEVEASAQGAAAEELLRRKGVKGALVGAPST
jgi:ATP/maltotriose-dependent transcriptional regulator MalT